MSHRNYEGCYCTDIRTLEDGTIEKTHSPDCKARIETLFEDLDKANELMGEKIKKESVEAMDRSLLGLAEEDPEHFAALVRAGLGVTKEQVDSYSHPKRLHHFGKPTPGDPFVAGMLQHLHDLPIADIRKVTRRIFKEQARKLPGVKWATVGIWRWTGWDADGSPTEEWP